MKVVTNRIRGLHPVVFNESLLVRIWPPVILVLILLSISLLSTFFGGPLIKLAIIEMLVKADSGHSAGPLGMTDIFTAL